MTATKPHFLVVNPNTTASMTLKIGEAARAAAGALTRITAVNPEFGPAAIQGPEDGAAALPGLFALVDQSLAADPSIDAIIIACFDDTGLWELKARLRVPVLGIGEAAYHVATLATMKFSVVTTLSVSVPVLKNNLQRMGFAERCVRVRASEVPVLALEDPAGEGTVTVRAEVARALKEDGVGAVALGCAGMAGLATELTNEFGVPVIDGVASAVSLAELLLANKVERGASEQGSTT